MLSLKDVGAYFSRLTVHARNINPGDKLDRGRTVRIGGTAVDVNAVYTILMDALLLLGLLTKLSRYSGLSLYMRRTQYCSIPVGHHEIVAIGETVRASL